MEKETHGKQIKDLVGEPVFGTINGLGQYSKKILQSCGSESLLSVHALIAYGFSRYVELYLNLPEEGDFCKKISIVQPKDGFLQLNIGIGLKSKKAKGFKCQEKYILVRTNGSKGFSSYLLYNEDPQKTENTKLIELPGEVYSHLSKLRKTFDKAVSLNCV